MSGLGGYCPLPIRLGGDQTTGWRAAQHARAAADLASVSRTAPLIWITFTIASGTVTINACNTVQGLGSDWYPTATLYVSTGYARFAFGPIWFDSYEIVTPLAFRHAKATAQSATPLVPVTQIEADLATVGIRLFTVGGVASDGSATLRIT